MASTATNLPEAEQVADRRGASVHLDLDPELLAAAHALRVNVGEACERGLRRTIGQERRAREFYLENKAAFDSHTAWVEKNGLILDRYRQF